MSQPAQVVIVVDRDPAEHERIAAALGGEHAVLGATTSAAAIKLAEKRPPAVVIVEATGDPGGPAASVGAAEALVLELRKRDPHVQAIFVCGPGAGRPPRLAARGSILVRPTEPAALRDLVTNCLRLKDVAEGVDRLHTGAGRASDVRRSAPTRREPSRR